MLIYTAGPITPAEGYSAEQNVASALRVYLALVASGVPTICPQLNGAFPSSWTAVTYEQWMTQAIAMIDRCTHVLLLPRWETSPGALREKAYAESIGKIVLTDASALIGVAL